MITSAFALEDVSVNRLPAAHAYELLARVDARGASDAVVTVRFEVRGRSLHVWPSFRHGDAVGDARFTAASASSGRALVRFVIPEPGRKIQGVEIENIYVHHVGEVGGSTPLAAIVGAGFLTARGAVHFEME